MFLKALEKNPRLYTQSPHVSLRKLTSLVESSKQTQLLPKPLVAPTPPPPTDAPLTFRGDFPAIALIFGRDSEPGKSEARPRLADLPVGLRAAAWRPLVSPCGGNGGWGGEGGRS